MDLEHIWKKGGGEDEQLNRLLQGAVLQKLPSKLPLQKLKKALLGGMVWAVLITTGYGVLFFFTAIWQVRLALVIVSAFNLWILRDTWQLYKRTNANITPTHTLKQELQRNYDSFRRWWRLQERVSLFIYPIAVAGGFILGGSLGSGKPVEEFLYRTKMLIALGICLVVLVPACYYLARWMFNYAYGKYLKNLQGLIAELEENES